MRRRIRLFGVLCWAVLACSAWAQEAPAAGGEKKETFAEKYELELRWANFLLLAIALGYLAKKNGGPFFVERSRKIRQDIAEAEEVRADAEKRAAAVDKRLASLESEVAAIRAESEREAHSERERMTQQTAAEMDKVRAHAEAEIASAAKTARAELKRYSAELAVGLAEQKVRARMNAQTEDALVNAFVRDLDGSKSRAAK
jgi:F-type H+-transporting ATPase subunit b